MISLRVCRFAGLSRNLLTISAVILIAYATMDNAEARGHRPRVVFVDADNRQIDLGDDPARVPDDAAGLLSPRGVR